MVGILLSYWGSLFSGAMLVSGRVPFVPSIPRLHHLAGAAYKDFLWKEVIEHRCDATDRLVKVGGGVPRETLRDSVWEDWGTLGNLRED